MAAHPAPQLAIDPGGVAGEAFMGRVESLFQRVLQDGAARLPGDRRHANRAAAEADGIEVPEALYRTILELAGPVSR